MGNIIRRRLRSARRLVSIKSHRESWYLRAFDLLVSGQRPVSYVKERWLKWKAVK